jgi:hypothetical protein
VTTLFRASAPVASTLPDLGPLANLPGTWVGKGFNLISLPLDSTGIFRLKLNATREVLTFAPVGAPIPDRGSKEPDIEFLGIHYLQRVSDAPTDAALHMEPGIWLNMPGVPGEPANVVRLATVPHGDSLLAQGSSVTDTGGPFIPVVSSTPIPVPPTPPLTEAYLSLFEVTRLPEGIPPGSIANPNLVLQEAIQKQSIISTTTLNVSTEPVGGIINIPFVVKNANPVRMKATFWIETVDGGDGNSYLQLQYSQTVILNFAGIDWPHISVATLVKQ